jgi:hypothetical protein
LALEFQIQRCFRTWALKDPWKWCDWGLGKVSEGCRGGCKVD